MYSALAAEQLAELTMLGYSGGGRSGIVYSCTEFIGSVYGEARLPAEQCVSLPGGCS